MAEIYIAFADTPGLFAGMIRAVLKQRYVHVLVAFDAHLEEAYSVGRRNPAIPFLAGFERENKRKILQKYPDAGYLVCAVECTGEQRRYVQEAAHSAWQSRFRYHYTVLGLPFLLLNRPFYQKNHYTCSSWLGKVLEEAGIVRWEKHFSLVTPKDFYEYENKQILFEGKLREFVQRDNPPKRCTAAVVRAAAYEA